MLREGTITPATSAWSFVVVILMNENGKPRFCVEYQILNRYVKADLFRLPCIKEVFEKLSLGVFFTTLDFFSVHWQTGMSDLGKEKPTVACLYGIFLCEFMQIGLVKAHFTFQRMKNSLMEELPFVKVHLKNAVRLSQSALEHINHIRLVLVISTHGLTAKICKRKFAKEQVSIHVQHVDINEGQADPKRKI